MKFVRTHKIQKMVEKSYASTNEQFTTTLATSVAV